MAGEDKTRLENMDRLPLW